METNELESVFALPTAKRYEYFVKQIVDREEVWGLTNDESWAAAGDGEGNIWIPFFPGAEFAAACARNAWEGFRPVAVGLHQFITEWVPFMRSENIRPAVFPNRAGGEAGFVDLSDLLTDIEREMANGL